MRKTLVLGTFLVLVVLVGRSLPYQFLRSGARWPSPTVPFYVEIPGANGLWNEAFEHAMGLWNERAGFNFRIGRNQYRDPCDPNTENGVAFGATDCGDSWGARTLAMAHTWSRSGVIYKAGIVFNRNESWTVYSGPYRSGVVDFRRVAVHELGHTIGLGHEDSVPAIMSTFAGDIEIPQTDDINGIRALYGLGPPISDTTGPGLSITSHASGQSVSTSTITLSGTASDAGRGDSGISSVTINGTRAGNDTASGSSTANWSSVVALNVGTNSIVVIAKDGSSNRNETVVTRSITRLSPPSNDNFSNAMPISGFSGRVTGTNRGATRETGEPGIIGYPSVWWRWQAPTTGSATFNTSGSDYDTVLAVYTGLAVSNFSLVAQNDDAEGVTSRVAFTATANVIYYIQVGGFEGATGNIVLNWQHVSTPPTITGMSPASGRPGTTFNAVITGNNLGEVSTPAISGEGVTVQLLSGGTTTSVPIQMIIANSAPVGWRRVTVTSSAGAGSAEVFVVASAGADLQVPVTLEPGYYTAEVTLASGVSRAGFWGMEVLASAGILSGGFNLGGGYDRAGGNPGFGGFLLNGTQTVSLSVNSQALPGEAPPRTRLQLLDRDGRPVGAPAEGSQTGFSIPLPAGYYTATIASATGRGTYQLALSSNFFNGGVVVGGFIAPGLIGFGGFNLPQRQPVTVRLYSSTYGTAASGAIQLALKDSQGRVVLTAR